MVTYPTAESARRACPAGGAEAQRRPGNPLCELRGLCVSLSWKRFGAVGLSPIAAKIVSFLSSPVASAPGRIVSFLSSPVASAPGRREADERISSPFLSSPVASAPGRREAEERISSPFQGASSHGFSPWSRGPGHQWLKPAPGKPSEEGWSGMARLSGPALKRPGYLKIGNDRFHYNSFVIKDLRINLAAVGVSPGGVR
jgi:hypothetical protein